MGENTKIEWASHTFNAWIGCTKVSDACDHCYAETLAKRWNWATWGPGEPRERTSAANWKKPMAWDRAAERDGVRRRVFCNSLSDVFDAEVPDSWRDELMDLIRYTPALDWLLLTKRPQVAKKWAAEHGLPANVWLGTTVENQAMAELRIPTLLSIPATKHFLSCEPLLGPVDLSAWPDRCWLRVMGDDGAAVRPRIDWVIAGGESGPGARPPLIGWVRSLRDQCQAAGVPFHFKQWGEFTPDDPAATHTSMRRVGKKKAGALLDGLEHREFPQ